MSDHKNNDPLERFFRKKAEDYNIQYRDEDWQKLESRLDDLDRQKTMLWRRRTAAAAVILLFSILGYFTYNQQQTINELNERLSKSERVTPAEQNSSPSNAQIIRDQEDGDVQNESSTDKQSNRPAGQNQDATANSDNTLASSEIENVQGLSQSYPATVDLPSAQMPDYNSTLTMSLAPVKVERLTETVQFSGNNNGANASLAAPFQANDASMTMQAPTPIQISRFSIGIVAGPDISTVGEVSNFYEPGHKFGISVEYQISKNLAVSAGALRSKVQYIASGNEYRPPQGYFNYGTAPDETFAKCVLIDIPVKLKYSFWQFDQSRLFATGGLSSYIMLDEDYRFKYQGSQSGQQRWHERTGTRHWASNATLSMGYELDISKYMSLRAEPFLNIPLQEVGWGNVELYSMGSFVSVNYTLH